MRHIRNTLLILLVVSLSLPAAQKAVSYSLTKAEDTLGSNQQVVETEFLDEEGGSLALKSYECTLTRGKGNEYTLSNAFNSGQDLTFNFDLAEQDESGWIPINYVESDMVYANQDGSGFVDYILHKPNNEHWTVTDMQGNAIELTRVCFREGNAWLHVEDKEDGDWYDYRAQLFYWAEATTGWLDSHYMTFYFDQTATGGGDDTPDTPPVAPGDEFVYRGIAYTVLDVEAKTCKTKNGAENAVSTYSGDVTIPSKVSYGNYEYTVTEIGNNSFYHATGLTAIHLSSSLRTISSKAFEGCTGLTSVTLPEGLNTIDQHAFSGCTNLKTIQIPASLRSIGTEAFYDSDAIATVTYDATKPIVGEFRIFSDIVYENATLNMPKASLADIQATEPWNKFTHIKAIDENILGSNQQEVEQVFSDEENGPAALQVITSVLTRVEGNTYTLENVFNSGNSLTFSFNPEEADEAGWAPITFVETEWTKPDPQDSYTDFILYAPDYATWTINDASGATVEMRRICFRQVNPDSWIYIDPDGWYQTQIYYWAESTDGWLEAHYLTFYFDRTAAGSGDDTPDTPPVAPGDEFEYNGIHYTILDTEARTCQTTPGPNFGDEPSNSYVGDLIIPSIVSDGQYQYTVVEIGGHGFQKCETITSLTLPNSVTTIGNRAFEHCSGLKSINFPNSIIHIGNDAFRYCTSLETLILPNSLTVLNSGVFADCTNLTSVTLPEELTTIHGEAFRACSSLKSLSLPASVITIESYAFAAPLTEITFYTSKPTEAPTDIFDEDTYEIATLNMPNANLADIETVSPWNRFQHIVAKDGSIVPDIYQIEFDRTEPASGTTVASLELISTWWTLPNTINITNDPIPYVTNEDGDRMDRIEVRLALNDRDYNNILINISPEITANGIYQIVIPAGAITDGNNPDRFTNDEVILTYTVKRDLIAGDDFEYQGLKYTVLDTEARTCETKEGTETTPGNSFEGDLVIPEKVSDGTNEYSVTRVGIYGFKGCNNISSLTLPISLTEIGEEAFMNCTGLTDLDLPRNITSIEGGAFDNCDGIVTVNLPEALVRIPDQCFHNCANLTTISFPETLKEIATDAFLECNKLVNITLPNTLSIIESGAFNGCALASLTLPASIDNIRSLAFHGCPIKIVNYEASKPVEAPSNIFDDVVYEDANLIMPNATLADIKATEPWNKFVHIAAQDNEGSGSNMVVNGDFENPDYVQSVPGEYTFSPVDTWENLSELPGWELSTNGVWNGVIGLVTDKDEIGKDLIRPVNGTNLLLFRGYVDNGWTTISASQLVKGLVPGREYNLDFLIAENQGVGAEWTPNPNYGFIVSEVNDGAEGKGIIDYTYTEQNPNLTYQAYKFIAPNDGRVYIRFFLMNDYYDGNYKDDLWMALDNVRIYDGEPNPPAGPAAGDKFIYQGIEYRVLDAENRTCIAHAPDYVGEVPTAKDSNTVIPETASDGTYDYTVTQIKESAFAGVDNLLSVTLPSSIENIGEDAFANCPRLTSLVWKAHRRMQEDVVPSIDNPNLLVYVDSLKFAPVELNHNIVVMDTESASPECQRLVIEPAYPFTPLHSFVSLNSSMTKEFSQTTPLGGCAGWETIVLPFDATSVAVSDARGELTPFSRITNIETQYPYWLYEADSKGEWKEAFGIQAGIPYLISMPNNEQYAVRYRISGPVTFSNPNAVTITPQTTAPYSVTWASGHQFRSLWLPLTEDEARDAMGLNVGIDNLTNDEGENLLPGSAFHVNVKPLPLEAYVTRYGTRRALPVRGGQSHAALLEADNALSVITKDGTIYLSGSYDRQVNIFRIDGVCVKSLDMKAGETCKVEGLAKGVYIVAGHKVIMK